MRFRKPQKNQTQTLKIIGVGVTLMIAIDLMFFGGYSYFQKARRQHSKTVSEETIYKSEIVDAVHAHADLPYSEAPDYFYSEPNDEYLAAVKRVQEMHEKKAPVKLLKTKPVVPLQGNPKVVIIIDDMGMNRTKSYEAVNLPGPMTLAFLPYAPALDSITKEAREKGHELLIHVPMEPMSAKMDPGPLALRDEMSEDVVRFNLGEIFKSFEGYVGINNHMGSKVTQNPDVMGWVMDELAQRDLIFVDSKTISTSVAADQAASYGLRFAERNVFLDHEDTPEFVMGALKKVEATARKHGVAIAIGHPKEGTIEALRAWIPTLKEKNLELVPVSRIVKRAEIKTSNGQSPDRLHEIEPSTY